MMMQRRHLEDPPPRLTAALRQLEERDLQHDRHRLGDEQAARLAVLRKRQRPNVLDDRVGEAGDVLNRPRWRRTVTHGATTG